MDAPDLPRSVEDLLSIPVHSDRELAPEDYQDDPRALLLRLGKRILRLIRLLDLRAPEPVVKRELKLIRKSVVSVKLHEAECVALIRSVHSGSELSDDYILKHMNHIAVAMAKMVRGEL